MAQSKTKGHPFECPFDDSLFFYFVIDVYHEPVFGGISDIAVASAVLIGSYQIANGHALIVISLPDGYVAVVVAEGDIICLPADMTTTRSSPCSEVSDGAELVARHGESDLK